MISAAPDGRGFDAGACTCAGRVVRCADAVKGGAALIASPLISSVKYVTVVCDSGEISMVELVCGKSAV